MKQKLLFLTGLLSGYFLYAQDDCASAPEITLNSLITVTAINGSQVPQPICAPNGAIQNSSPAGEWYKFTATQNQNLTLTTDLQQNSGKDTRVHIYTGSCQGLTCYAGDDDSGEIGTGYLSICNFTVSAGTTYYIAFDNRWNSSGFDFILIPQTTPVTPVVFTPQTIPTSATICCVADMNGDYLDDIVTVQTNGMTILHQQANGGFTTSNYSLPGLTTQPGWSITAGDFDKNGYNDLVFGGGSRLCVIKANSTGTGYTEIPYPQYIFTQRANFIDINNDGNLDLFACHDTAQSHAYRNDGNGNLTLDISFFPTLAVGGNYASIWTDFNNDGYQDMYLAKCRGGAPVGDPQRINLLYKNNGNGTFTEVGATAGVNDGSQSWSTAIEDFDNDGDMDFLLSNISDTNKLYRNNGDGTFTDVYATSGISPQVGSWEIQAVDFNNDGWVDFLWQNGKELYINNGNMTFSSYDLPFSEGGIGDLNNDGFLDVQMGNTVYYNQPNGNNWVTINLQGNTSNRNGIGARVELIGAWGKQIREIRSGSGFSHQSTLNAHFGIGTADQITQAVIKWPSGIVDRVDNPAINQQRLIVEGSTLGVTKINSDAFKIYPNPAKDILNITMKNGQAEIVSAEIYDLQGRKVLTSTPLNNSVNVENLTTQTYVLILETADGIRHSQKFVKN
ncbi:T9SS type A sorting domain-containing protein [Flavobacterium sp. NST-5]|uniref:T9SS type A sorting domain-containing protein n=1 Tax=Flavobacterium ichthyis TaxID=2698827 RepID=A0ABW9ZAU4_9FLAO|nr:FG-GAP-like repeat-containing protein [Flavobacterium ichthyis]NBL66021.1 T9SS type A sorting domain-containing protein [Flavobacterium ichthyis]